MKHTNMNTSFPHFSPKEKFVFSLLVNVVVLLVGMSTDIYLPSLPAIQNYFHVTRMLVQLTVTSYTIGLAFSQLIAGPISDAYGRKKLLLGALLLEVVTLLAIVFSPSIHWMIVCRGLEGLGAGLMIVPARAILNDVFEGHDLKKQFNYITISFAVGPIIAPFIGSYLQHYIGWQANFSVLLGYAIILFIVVMFWYKETLSRFHPFAINHFWNNYRTILSSRVFIIGVLLSGCVIGYSALFNVLAPFMIQVTLHHSALVYGRIALLLGFAWFCGNILNRLLFHVDKKHKSLIGLWCTLVAILIMIVLNYLAPFNLITLVAPVFLIVLLSGAVFSIYVAESLTLFSQLAGSANGCLFSLVWVIYSLFTYIGTLISATTLLPLAIVYAVTSILALIIFYNH